MHAVKNSSNATQYAFVVIICFCVCIGWEISFLFHEHTRKCVNHELIDNSLKFASLDISSHVTSSLLIMFHLGDES